MSAIQEQVKLLQDRFSNHHYQTDGFTWDFVNATDEQVRDTASVFDETITGLSSIILKAITPKHRPQLRRQIAYLIGLRQRQVEAWERYIADCQTRANNTNKWVLQNER